MKEKLRRIFQRVDLQVSLFTAAMVMLSCLAVFALQYTLTYQDSINSLAKRAEALYNQIDKMEDKVLMPLLTHPEDMDTPLYERLHASMYQMKQSADVRYFYVAARADDGSFIYTVDGLDPNNSEFRKPGDPIESEIVPELERAMAGETVLPDAIKNTEWGKIFIAYLPIRSGGEVVGVTGVEFEAEAQFDTYQTLRMMTPIVILAICLIAGLLALLFFRRISNPFYQDMSNTDYLTKCKNRNAFQVDMRNADVRRGSWGSVGVVMLDLNNLKKVNDALGHSAGDRYLQCAAQAIQECGIANAIPYRIGGDEFVVLFPAPDEAAVDRAITLIHTRFQSVRPMDWNIDLSLSAGGALCSGGVSFTEAYRRADALMYEEKQKYHNR